MYVLTTQKGKGYCGTFLVRFVLQLMPAVQKYCQLRNATKQRKISLQQNNNNKAFNPK
jgi:predicted GIY-YIG superfamily endonuclease